MKRGGGKKRTQELSVYDRVTEILREQGHPDPENASEFDRFSGAMKRVMQTPHPLKEKRNG